MLFFNSLGVAVKISILFKVLILTLLVGLFIGCGSGSGEGGACMGGSNGATCNDGAESEEGGSDDENNDNKADNDTNVSQPITAHLVYPALEENITHYKGMFNLVADNQIEPEHLDNHSTAYSKEIVYHNVDAGIATRLYAMMNGTTYPEVPCAYVRAIESDVTWCQEFGREYRNLPTDVLTDGIYSADIIFNQEATGCADGSGICDITLIVWADSRYHNHTKPIPLDIFKRAFTASDKDNGGIYSLSSQMKIVLADIEKNATTVSLGVDNWHNHMNLSTYINVNNTIHKYTDQLSINNGSILTFPQIPMKLSGLDGGGATLEHKGALYKLENTYKFKSETSDPYDVNETDTSGKYYYMANVTTGRDSLSLVTLCQRTANATKATATANATNATYACEIGTGNITNYWWLQGKDVNLSW
jgi:hypothetical protein